MNRIQQIARAWCEAEGLNPEQVIRSYCKGSRYHLKEIPLWKAFEERAEKFSTVFSLLGGSLQ